MKKTLAAAVVLLTLALGSAAFFFTSALKEEAPAIISAKAPPAIGEEETIPDPAESFLSIPVAITAGEAERLLAGALENPLYDVRGQKLDDSYGESTADILVEKTGTVAVTFEEDRGEIALPFRFESRVRWKGKILGISSSTTQDIAGGGRLRLTVNPRIDRDWKIRLQGSLSVEWKENPAITVLGQKIGIGRFLASLLEDRSRDLLKRAEEELNQSARLKERAREHWDRLGTPIPLTTSPRLALSIRPLALSIPPFTAKKGALTAHLALRCLLHVTSEEGAGNAMPPLPALMPLPPGTDPGVLINVDSFISYRALEEFLGSSPAPTLEIPGGGRVNVEKISLFGSGDKLIAAADISGSGPLGSSLKGKVYLAGKPEYSREAQELRVRDVDFDEDSTRGLMKAASWIARPMVARAVEESLVFPLGDLRDGAIASLGKTLEGHSLSEELHMAGEVHSLELETLRLTPRGLYMSFSLGGAVSLHYRVGKEDVILKQEAPQEAEAIKGH